MSGFLNSFIKYLVNTSYMPGNVLENQGYSGKQKQAQIYCLGVFSLVGKIDVNQIITYLYNFTPK